MREPILVTGGAGYVGNRVARALYKKGFLVRVYDSVSPRKRYVDFPKAIEIIQGDLRDKDRLLGALNGVGLVVHLAANIGSMSYMDAYPADILRDNVAIDSVLYPALVAAGVKKILYSSSSMVFQHPPQFPYQESDLAEIRLPTNIYGFSKLVGEYFCRAYHKQYGLEYVIVRYHNIYGPGEQSKILNSIEHSGYIHVIPALIEKVLRGQYPLELLGGMNDTRPFTYIDDAVMATVLLVEKILQNDSKVLNEDFHIGPRGATRILTLAELIWNLYGDSRPFAYMTKAVETTTAKRREMDPKKIYDAVGWEPQVSLEEGLAKTAEWMKGKL